MAWLTSILVLLGVSLLGASCHKFSRVDSTVKDNTENASLPVVLWHGMGDTCCNPLSMGGVKRLVEGQLPGTTVISLEIGGSIVADLTSGFLTNVNDQIDFVCQSLQNNPALQNGYNGMGFSQGGLFLRALVQRCPSPTMHNLVSFGGPQQGVFGFPHCVGNSFLCETVRKALDEGAYESHIQDHVVQAQYWHDPLNADQYREKNVFLADVNQENGVNKDYATRLAALDSLVLVRFLQDTMVVPSVSEWFGFFNDGQDVSTYDVENSTLYTEDKLGLRKLDSAGRLHLLSIDADHLQIPEDTLEKIVVKYFK
jgi:palmitoyl-protein thioesterase